MEIILFYLPSICCYSACLIMAGVVMLVLSQWTYILSIYITFAWCRSFYSTCLTIIGVRYLLTIQRVY